MYTEFTSKCSLDLIMDRVMDYYDNDVDVRTDYSGRGMYDRECIGFVVETGTVIIFLMALTAALVNLERDGEDVPNWMDLNSAQDNMAMDAIVYFPNWQLDKED